MEKLEKIFQKTVFFFLLFVKALYKSSYFNYV